MRLALLLLCLGVGCPLSAQELLQNGDFADGERNWGGDVKLAAPLLSTDLTTNSTPANGVAIEMHTHGTTMWQGIKGFAVPADSGVDVTIDYWTSSDFALKTRGAITEPIMVTLSETPNVQFAEYGGFSTPSGGFYCLPEKGGNPGTFQATVSLPATQKIPDTIWFKMWFPPGNGVIFFKKISVTMHNGPVKAPGNSALRFLKPLPEAAGNSGNAPQSSGTTSPANAGSAP